MSNKKEAQPIEEHQGAKYITIIRSSAYPDQPEIKVDIYDIIESFKRKNPTLENPGIQHALKKLLDPGARGKGSILSDLWGAHAALQRAIQIEEDKIRQYEDKHGRSSGANRRGLWKLTEL